MTFSSHVFPIKKATIFSIPYLFVLLTQLLLLLIQCTGCFQLETQFQLNSTTWDFAIVHKREVTFAALGSEQRHRISIPAPTAEIGTQRLSLSSSSNNSTLNLTHDKGTGGPSWSSQWFNKLELDVERGLLFLTSDPLNLQSLVVFNITSTKTYSVVRNDSSAPISALVYHKEWLYWTESESSSGTIRRMNTSNEITTWKPDAQPFYESLNCTLSELAIHAKLNTFFFIRACETGAGKTQLFTIQYLSGTHHDGESPRVVRESNHPLHALTTDASYLYWVDHPSGFSIQRVPLDNLKSNSQVLYSGQKQLINSVSVAGCSSNDASIKDSLLWASCNRKAVEQRDNFARGGEVKTKTLTFGRICPRGLISRSFAYKNWDSSFCPRTFITATNTTTTTTTELPLLSKQDSIPNDTVKTTTSTPIVKSLTTTPSSSSSSSSTTTTPATTTTTPTSSVSAISTTTKSSVSNPPPTVKTIITNENRTTNVSSAITPVIISSSSSSSPSVPSSNPLEYNPVDRTRPGTLEIALIVLCSSLLVLVVILLVTVVFLYRKVRRLQKKPRIRRRVIVSRSRDNNVPSSSSMCELVDIENCCNMNECETPCYERLGPDSSMHQDYKSEGKARTEDKERLIEK